MALNFYLLYLFSNNKYFIKKIYNYKLKLILVYNYIFFFSYKISYIKLVIYILLKLFFYFNLIFKRFLVFRGKGGKFVINSLLNLYINNNLSHTVYFNLDLLNFDLIKYNFIQFNFNNFIFMNKFIKSLEKIKKEDRYNFSGIYDSTKVFSFKLGKKDQKTN